MRLGYGSPAVRTPILLRMTFVAAVGGLLGGVPSIGCGTNSLDGADVLGPTTDATRGTTTSGGDAPTVDDGEVDTASDTTAAPDVPPASDDVCAPGCSAALELQWTVEAAPPAAPPPKGEWFARATAALWHPNGVTYVAEYRTEGAFIIALEPSGATRWVAPLQLDCDCTVTSLVPSTDGGIAFTAQTVERGFGQAVEVGLLDVESGSVIYSVRDFLFSPTEDPYRYSGVWQLPFGPLAVVSIQPVLLGGKGQFPSELLSLLLYDGADGFLIDGRTIGSQPITDGRYFPVLRGLGGLDWVSAFALYTGGPEEALVVWGRYEGFALFDDTQFLPFVVDDMFATDHEGAIAAGRHSLDSGTTELRLELIKRDIPPLWSTAWDLEAELAGPVHLATDAEGRMYAGLLTKATPDSPRDLQVHSLRRNGELLRHVSVPAGEGSVDELYGFAVTDDADVIVATTQDERFSVEKRSPACVCD